MARRSRRAAKLTRRKRHESKKWLWGGVSILLLLLMGGVWLVGRSPGESIVVQIRGSIIPTEGAQTSYGIPLSLDNTQRFIDYYGTMALTPAQEQRKREALLPLRVPCCDDNSMATCCCVCNLARSVWGLSGYLVAERNYTVVEVREAALQWLRFIHPNYYVVQEMKNRGINPGRYGLQHENPCYAGECELPFREGGCGGMGVLRQ